MNEIICPHCNKAFKIDEAGFADILKQVRDHEFEKELHERAEMFERDKESAIKLAEANLKNTLQADLARKEAELVQLKANKDRELAELEVRKETELAEIKSKISNADLEKKLAVTEAVNKIEKERDELAGELKNKDTEKQLLETSLKERFTTLSNKNPPERERFKGNLSTYKMCLGVPNHSYLPIDRMTLLLALSTTEESSRAK